MMYTITICNSENTPFNIVADYIGLSSIAYLLGMNSSTTFKVFEAGRQLMPIHFGWGNLPGWVEKFYYESQTA